MERGRHSRISVTDIPSTIFVEILLKLPVKSIVMCKSVCKTWYGLISDPQFAKLHLAQAKSCALIRAVDSLKFSRSLYFLEPEDASGLYSGYCHCRARNQRCENCRYNTEVKFKLKVPLRNAQVMLDRVDNSNASVMLCIGTTRKNKRLIRLDSRYDHCYNVVSSSNGFICLSNPGFREDSTRASFCICNPVTGEFTYVPQGCSFGNGNKFISGLGFGFSPKHNQYKVIRMPYQWRQNHVTGIRGYRAVVAEIHTIGTDSWRHLDIPAFDMPTINYPSYLNGALYWISPEYDTNVSMTSFDLDNEQFHIHSIPSLPSRLLSIPRPQLGIAVLGGRLFVYTKFTSTHVDIWLANECGISLSWTHLFSIDVTELHNRFRWFYYQLVCCVNCESVVLFGGPQHEFIYYDQSEGLRFKQPKFDGLKSNFEVIAFTPSFLSLKDAVMLGSNTEVFNINSRCGKIKLLEETYPLLLCKTRNLKWLAV